MRHLEEYFYYFIQNPVFDLKVQIDSHGIGIEKKS